MPTSPPISFPIEALHAIRKWAEGQRLGFSVATDHADFPEAVELWPRRRSAVAFSLFQRQSGLIEVTDHDAGDCIAVDGGPPAACAWIEQRWGLGA